MSEESIIPVHGGYRTLKSFQRAQLLYDLTVYFCNRFISIRSRTHDQMVQAARSGVQNIAEGSLLAGTSRKMELKLTNVARASLEELRLDYEDFLRHRSLEIYMPNHPILVRYRKTLCKSMDEIRRWVASEYYRVFRSETTQKDNQSACLNLKQESLPVHVSPCQSLPSIKELAANAALSLLNVTTYLLDRQIATLAKAFEKEGGFSERLYRVRVNKRKKT